MAVAAIQWGTLFLSTVLASFAVALLASGLFGAFYGQGRSRATGFILVVVALLLGGLFAALTWQLVPGITPVFRPELVGQAALAVLAGTIGTLLAVGVFIVSVMRG